MIQRMGRIVRKKQEGVMAKFLIFYVFGTPEDPQVGGQDAFLEIVTDPAESVEYFDLASVENLADFLSN